MAVALEAGVELLLLWCSLEAGVDGLPSLLLLLPMAGLVEAFPGGAGSVG